MPDAVDLLSTLISLFELVEKGEAEQDFHEFLVKIADFLECDYIHISIDKSVSRFRYETAFGFSPDIMNLLFSELIKYANPVDTASYHRTGVLKVTEYTNVEFEESSSTMQVLGIKAVLSIPLYKGGNQVGRITALNSNPKTWTETDETVLNAAGLFLIGLLTLQKNYSTLHESIKNHTAIEAAIPDFLFVINQRLEIEAMNKVAREFFKDHPPQNLFELFEPSERGRVLSLLSELREYNRSKFEVVASPYLEEGNFEIIFARILGARELEEKNLLVARPRGAEEIIRKELIEQERLLRQLFIEALGRETLHPSDVNSMFPSAYAISFNETVGPIIVAASPPIKEEDVNPRTWSAAIRLVSAIDFQDVSAHQFVTGSFPWPEPVGTFYYVAFVIPNPKSRGGEELHVLGINANRDFEDIILGPRNILLGLLHHAMNEYVKILEMDNADFVTGNYSPSLFSSTRAMISKALEELRVQATKTLSEWYVIPFVDEEMKQ